MGRIVRRRHDYLSRHRSRPASPDPLAGKATHFKACWVDVTDPKEQAYAEKRRQTRIEKVLAATNVQLTNTQAVSEEQ